MNETYKIILILLFLILTKCSRHKTNELPERFKKLADLTTYPLTAQPIYKIKLKRGISYGSKKGIFITVGGPSENVVRIDKKGRVFIPDRQQNTIHVFAPDGRYVTHIGREGRGPGEFLRMFTVRIGWDHLYVFDDKLKRITAFSLDSLALTYTVNLEQKNWEDIKELRNSAPTGYFFVGKNGDLLMQFAPVLSDDPRDWTKSETRRDNQCRYYLMDNKGRIISGEILEQREQRWTIDTFRGMRVAFKLPVYGKPLLVMSGNGDIFSAWSEDFLIKKYNPNGQYLHSFYYPFKKSILVRNNLIKRYDFGFDSPQLHTIHNLDLPTTWPALNSMKIDDQNRLWISTIVPDQKVYQWWVLNQKGKLLARFTWPRDKPIEVIKNGYLYTMEKNKKNGMEQIVRYRIMMNHIKNKYQLK